MDEETLILKNLMNISTKIGAMETEIRNTCRDMVIVQKDVSELNKKFHENSLILTPTQTKSLIGIIAIILGALGYTQI